MANSATLPNSETMLVEFGKLAEFGDFVRLNSFEKWETRSLFIMPLGYLESLFIVPFSSFKKIDFPDVTKFVEKDCFKIYFMLTLISMTRYMPWLLPVKP